MPARLAVWQAEAGPGTQAAKPDVPRAPKLGTQGPAQTTSAWGPAAKLVTLMSGGQR